MNRKIITMFVLFLTLIVTNAMAGPFGLYKGMSLKEIGGKPEKLQNTILGNGIYKINVPKPHSAFEAYIVKVAPKGGLCWIRAIGKDIATSSYGLELKSAFSEMEEKLGATYGKHEIMDVLYPGSIWDRPNDWMMGLIKKERILLAVWEKSEGSSLPSDIEQIGLIVGPTSRDKGYIEIEYSFTNKEACEAELAAGEDDAL